MLPQSPNHNISNIFTNKSKLSSTFPIILPTTPHHQASQLINSIRKLSPNSDRISPPLTVQIAPVIGIQLPWLPPKPRTQRKRNPITASDGQVSSRMSRQEFPTKPEREKVVSAISRKLSISPPTHQPVATLDQTPMSISIIIHWLLEAGTIPGSTTTGSNPIPQITHFCVPSPFWSNRTTLPDNSGFMSASSDSEPGCFPPDSKRAETEPVVREAEKKKLVTSPITARNPALWDH